jgi:hypothetical protein
MKKKKQSKKRWAWTEAQVRRHWSVNKKWGGGVPRWFCRIIDNHDKRRCQKALRELKHGGDPEDFIFNPKYNGRSAQWLWW